MSSTKTRYSMSSVRVRCLLDRTKPPSINLLILCCNLTLPPLLDLGFTNWTWTELKGTHAAKRMCFQNIWTDSGDCHVIYVPFGESRLNTGREDALPSGCIKHFEFISECRLSKGKPSMNILWDNENSSGFFFSGGSVSGQIHLHVRNLLTEIFWSRCVPVV